MLWWMIACTTPPTTPAPEPAPTEAPKPAPAPAAPEPAPAAPEPVVYGLRGVDVACAVCGEMRNTPAVDLRASASSTLGPKYAAKNIIDPAFDKAWCEGKPGNTGVGETLTIELGRPLTVAYAGVYGGFFKSLDLLRANGRIKSLRITSDGGLDEVVHFADPGVAMKTDPSLPKGDNAIDDWWKALTEGEPPWKRLADSKPSTRVTLEILEVYPGAKYDDTCISRVDLLVVDPEEL